MGTEEILAGIALANALIQDLIQVSNNVAAQQAAGRDPTPDEIALAQKVTAQKAALAAAS